MFRETDERREMYLFSRALYRGVSGSPHQGFRAPFGMATYRVREFHGGALEAGFIPSGLYPSDFTVFENLLDVWVARAFVSGDRGRDFQRQVPGFILFGGDRVAL